jgi:REP element-mobilizing transposase RayT
MLTVCPNFFIYKWEVKKNETHLLVEIPENIGALINGESNEEKSQEPYSRTLTDQMLLTRRVEFSRELDAICYEAYR